MEEENSFRIKDKRHSAGDVDAGSAANPEAADRKAGEKQKSPSITFSTFILSLSSSAAMHMGGYQDPISGHVPKNLEMAKQSIDMLGMLQEKTKGNLTPEEQELLDSALYELRMRYIEEKKNNP